MAAKLLTILLVGVLCGAAVAQNCGCASGLCCSKHGYCGTGNDYSGDRCQSGPCYSSGGGGGSSGGSSSVADIVTQAFFDGIINQAASNCAGKNFYTRAAFIDALNSYPEFGSDGSAAGTKREIGAFFAHVPCHTRDWILLLYRRNQWCLSYSCDSSNTQYPCVAGQNYYGRGPLQLTSNYNYGAARKAIGFDGLGNPGIVAKDVVISFKTALWFWMTNIHSVAGQGFGATIRAINGAVECNGGNTPAVNARVGYYKDYCSKFGVSPGDNVTC